MSFKQKPTFRFVVICIAVLFISLLFSDLLTRDEGSNVETQVPAYQDSENLISILEKINGVGKVAVYFHYDVSSENTSESDDLSLFQWTSDSKKDKEELIGILVVAEGANDKRIQNSLIKTLSSVLQISPHRIVIEEMELEDK
ncbi:stage III sporulation protein AG [Paenisporosarcina quisquiliarum]|nr:stage III sporulation protein AG [Paenisporosarcina quisquiliarum]